MRCFELYQHTNIEAILREDNDIIYGESNNQYQEGFGHGFIFGSVYNNSLGSGQGNGFDDGKGIEVFPFELIQYWR